MSRKLIITDEMVDFAESPAISNENIGIFFRLLIKKYKDLPIAGSEIPGTIAVVWNMFDLQIDRFKKLYDEKCEKARKSVKQRWGKSSPEDIDTNVSNEYERIENIRTYKNDTIKSNQNNPTQINSNQNGGGGASHDHTDQEPHTTTIYSISDYISAATNVGLPESEARKFGEYNTSGRLSPIDALERWMENRTPTECAGGTKAVEERERATKRAQSMIDAKLNELRKLLDGWNNTANEFPIEQWISENDSPSLRINNGSAIFKASALALWEAHAKKE